MNTNDNINVFPEQTENIRKSERKLYLVVATAILFAVLVIGYFCIDLFIPPRPFVLKPIEVKDLSKSISSVQMFTECERYPDMEKCKK